MSNPVLDYKRVRIRFDADKFQLERDILASATPAMYRGNDASFEVVIYWKDQIINATNIATLTFSIWTIDCKSRKATKTITAAEITAIPSEADWSGGTAQHAVFPFTGQEMNWALTSPKTEETFMLVLAGVTNHTPGRNITYGRSSLKIIEDAEGNAAEYVVNDPLYYTQIDADGRFVQLQGDGYTFRAKKGTDGNVYQQFYFQEEGKWRSRIPRIVGGQPNITWGEPED